MLRRRRSYSSKLILNTISIFSIPKDGAPPTIQYIAVVGSAIVELSGELYVFPGSTVWLDCLWPRSLGRPYWSWTQSYRHYDGEIFDVFGF